MTIMNEIDVWISYEKATLETYIGSNFTVYILSINLYGTYVQVNKSYSISVGPIEELTELLKDKIKSLQIENEEFKNFVSSL
jgi:hypothetical protein